VKKKLQVSAGVRKMGFNIFDGFGKQHGTAKKQLPNFYFGQGS